jgi:hypothetical protein
MLHREASARGFASLLKLSGEKRPRARWATHEQISTTRALLMAGGSRSSLGGVSVRMHVSCALVANSALLARSAGPRHVSVFSGCGDGDAGAAADEPPPNIRSSKTSAAIVPAAIAAFWPVVIDDGLELC